MKTLFINRHAKSDWNQQNSADFDRPLNERGRLDAPEMGKRLARRGEHIQLYLSSPANRAISTAKAIAATTFYPEENICEDKRIYHANVEELLNVLSEVDDSYDSVIIFGHNPGLTNLAEYLTGDRFGNLPTCSLVKITFNVDTWQALSRDTGQVAYYDYPKKELRD